MEGLNSFLQSLKEIPNEEKRAYLLALAKAPHLLHRESCIERFLQCDPKQAERVARKFVDYWEKRKQVFDDDAFQPLTLLEPWTLSESCKSLLELGWISPLPPDKTGHRVCMLNLSVEQGQHHILPEDKARSIFYILQCLSEDKSTQKQGISLLIVYDDMPHVSHTASIKTLDEILQVFPIRVASLHVVYSGDRDGRASFYDNVLPIALKTLLNSPADGDQDALLDQRSHIYVDKTPKALLNELERYGLRRESLPCVLGGNWSSAHHEAWLKVRQQDETRQASEAQALGAFSFPGKDATTGGVVAIDVREKLRDAWHSKLKRTRKRCRTKALQIQVTHLRDQQRKAKATTKRLEQAIKDANRIVSTIEAQPVASRPFASVAIKPVAPVPIANHSLAALQFYAPQVHVVEAPRLLSFTGMPSQSMSMAVRAEHPAIRAERDRLFMAGMVPPTSTVSVLPIAMGNSDLYHGMAHHPTFYSAPHSSLTYLNNHSTSRRHSLAAAAIAPPGVLPGYQEWNSRYF